MNIYGLDFTSAPRQRKPITCAECVFDDALLSVRNLHYLTDFSKFEDFLGQAGPWIAGFDFPFGQPARLVRHMEWGTTWAAYVRYVEAMTKGVWEQALRDYENRQPKGDQLHLRAVDILAKSQSPMKLDFIPVGKMFFQGAPRLLRSGASILPDHPRSDNRILVEAYPALVARKWVGRQSYKTDTRKKQTVEHRQVRQRLVDALLASCRDHYGFACEVGETITGRLVDDPSGDSLDAVLCAVQAAWAYTQREQAYGIPTDCDPLEGWIVDPEMLDRWHGK